MTTLLLGMGAAQASAQRPAPVPIEGFQPMPEQMAARLKPLTPPSVSVYATPVAVTISWKPVQGAASYIVEQAPGLNGPWYPLPFDPRAGTQVTAPTSAGSIFQGVLYYYRVSAVSPPAPPGVTVVPGMTPFPNAPVGVWANQDGADVQVTWAPVPHATGYVITAASGQQLPPTHTVEVGAQYAQARLVNVALPNFPRDVWVAVNARYGPAMSHKASRKFIIGGVQTCWPPSAVPGPIPTVFITSKGPAAFSIETAKSQHGAAAVRVERAPMGSQAWQGIGCSLNNGPVFDPGLTPGTQYQYRVTDITGSGAVGQTIIAATTPLVPDNPTPTATVGACSAKGCQVTVNWIHVAGAEDYRVESSYGLYWDRIATGGPYSATNFPSMPGGLPLGVQVGNVPSGVHAFRLTALFFPAWPSPRAPGQVTVVVP